MFLCAGVQKTKMWNGLICCANVWKCVEVIDIGCLGNYWAKMVPSTSVLLWWKDMESPTHFFSEVDQALTYFDHAITMAIYIYETWGFFKLAPPPKWIVFRNGTGGSPIFRNTSAGYRPHYILPLILLTLCILLQHSSPDADGDGSAPAAPAKPSRDPALSKVIKAAETGLPAHQYNDISFFQNNLGACATQLSLGENRRVEHGITPKSKGIIKGIISSCSKSSWQSGQDHTCRQRYEAI